MGRLLGEASLREKDLDLAVRRYFEVIYADEMDTLIYLLGFSKSHNRSTRIEGGGPLKKVLKSGAGILLTAHFGGGFWSLPWLKEAGMKAHFFSANIKGENYPFNRKALYLYEKLWVWVVARASGGKVLFKAGGRKDLVETLRGGRWVIVLLDVPPFMIKEKMEVSFLGKKAWFPTGILSIAAEMNVPVVPYFSYLEKGMRRRICFEKPIYVKDEDEAAKACVGLIEARIRQRPDHWHLWPFADQFFSSS